MKPSPACRDWRPVPRPWDEHWLRNEVAGVFPGGDVASHSVNLQDLGNKEIFFTSLNSVAIWQKAGQCCNRKNQETAAIVMAAVAAA